MKESSASALTRSVLSINHDLDLLPELRTSPETTDCEDRGKVERKGRDIHMPQVDLFADEGLHCGLIFSLSFKKKIFLEEVTFGVQVWHKVNSDKGSKGTF